MNKLKRIIKLFTTDYYVLRGIAPEDRKQAKKYTRLFILSIPIPICLFWMLTTTMNYIETLTDYSGLVFFAIVAIYCATLILIRQIQAWREP